MTSDQQNSPEPARTSTPGYQLGLMALLFIWSVFCLFYHLGDTPLWGDEADTALYGRSFARTGGLNAVIDHNIYAFNQGMALTDLRLGAAPPLPYLLAAPFVGSEGTSALMARLPFAICGLLAVILMVYWLRYDQANPMYWWVFSAGLAGSAAYWLFCRQCRYYSLALLLSLAIVFLYVHWRGSRWTLLWMSILSIALIGTHYLPHAGLYAALFIDYVFFGRKRRKLGFADWLVLLAPQVIGGALIVALYNPLGREFAPSVGDTHPVIERLLLIYWSLRDLSHAEFAAGIALLAAPVIAWWRSDLWLMRAMVALVIYVIVVSILSPQVVSITQVADVRYLSALIPLCIFIVTSVIVGLAQNRLSVALLLSGLVFFTNILNFPLAPRAWRSTTVSFVREIITHRPTALAETIDWIDGNVAPGESIWVTPDYLPFPLEFHAPHALYAWQLDSEPAAKFRGLPAIHFFKQQPVDVIVAFGWRDNAKQLLAELEKKGVKYQREKLVRRFWDDRTRPELFWHSFKPVDDFPMGSRAVYIFRRAPQAEKPVPAESKPNSGTATSTQPRPLPSARGDS